MEDRLISVKDEAESVENLKRKTKIQSIPHFHLVKPKLWHIFSHISGIVEGMVMSVNHCTKFNGHPSNSCCNISYIHVPLRVKPKNFGDNDFSSSTTMRWTYLVFSEITIGLISMVLKR